MEGWGGVLAMGKSSRSYDTTYALHRCRFRHSYSHAPIKSRRDQYKTIVTTTVSQDAPSFPMFLVKNQPSPSYY